MNIAIFVSGSGTNCENLIRHFADSENVKVSLVVSNKPDAYALVRAERLGVPTAITPKAELNNPDVMMPLLQKYDIGFIVLAGFLPLVPNFLIEAYPHKIINIQGVLGQGSAAGQTRGLLQGLVNGGRKLGAEIDDIMTNESNTKLDGTQDVEIVFWAAGNWAADPAQKAMTDAITSLGADGFDAVYVQNNPMCEGVLNALKDAGLNPSDYLITSCNGREMSWQWAKDGIVAQDVNQPASMEGNVLYQQIKAWSLGQDYRKYVHPYLTSYTKDTIGDLEASLVPVTDVDAFLKGVADGAFVTDLNDPKFIDNAGY